MTDKGMWRPVKIGLLLLLVIGPLWWVWGVVMNLWQLLAHLRGLQ
jgi:hypothetical protein